MPSIISKFQKRNNKNLQKSHSSRTGKKLDNVVGCFNINQLGQLKAKTEWHLMVIKSKTMHIPGLQKSLVGGGGFEVSFDKLWYTMLLCSLKLEIFQILTYTTGLGIALIQYCPIFKKPWNVAFLNHNKIYLHETRVTSILSLCSWFECTLLPQ